MPRKIKKAQSLDVDIERATKNKKSSIDDCVFVYTKNNSDKNAWTMHEKHRLCLFYIFNSQRTGVYYA